MLLLVDAGNSNTVFGLALDPGGAIDPIWRLASRRDRPFDEWFALLLPLLQADGLDPRDISGVAISSVVPSITDSLVRLSRERLGRAPVVVSAALDLGIAVRTERPLETGSDRLANAVAAAARHPGPALIIDAGTATKVDAVTGEPAFLGGAIAPGIEMSRDALAARAARLFAVDLVRPPRAIGSNTIRAIQSGVVEGHIALIEGLSRRMIDELGGVASVILTGGNARIVAGHLPIVTSYEPDLTLEGVRLIHHRNPVRA